MPNVPTGRADAGAAREGQGGMGEHDELLTVAEAAARVGLSERTLARILESDSFAGRTVTAPRDADDGAGPAALVPPPLMAELRASYEMGRAIFDGAAPAAPAPDAASLAAQIASARETILRADQARDLAEQGRARAEAALDRGLLERDAEAQRLHAALTRAQDALTQALTALTQEQQRARQLEAVQAQRAHALPAPPALAAPDADAPDAPASEPASDTERDGGDPTLDRQTLGVIEAQIQAARARDRDGFWGRLWRGLAD